MFGGDVPDLATTPCPACGELVQGGAVWDPYHTEDRRFAAIPYHRSCAGDVLPPARPTPEMLTCGICQQAFSEQVFATGFAALHARFTLPKAAVATPEVVWRLAGRDPRAFLAEHFQCLLGSVRPG